MDNRRVSSVEDVRFPIHTARLTLRPFVDTDLDDLYAYQSRPDVARYLYWDARDRTQVVAALATKVAATRLTSEGDAIVLAAALREGGRVDGGRVDGGRVDGGRVDGGRVVGGRVVGEGGRVIGEVSLEWRSVTHRQGECGFVFNPEFHGHGYATEAAREILRLGFETVGLHRIIGRCDALNEASARVMQRLGMRREAHFIHNEIFKGQWGDEYVYAMLDEEWRNAT